MYCHSRPDRESMPVFAFRTLQHIQQLEPLALLLLCGIVFYGMKSSPIAKMKAQRRTRHIPVIAYFAQIFSSDLNQNLSELLNLDAFTEQESRKCDDGKSITVWPVNLDQVKKLFAKPRRHFDIWQSKDEGDLTKVTTELQKKLFKQKVSRGARIKRGSEIEQPKWFVECYND